MPQLPFPYQEKFECFGNYFLWGEAKLHGWDDKLVAQRQDMVSDTLALPIYILVNVFIKVILSGSRAAAPRGTKSCRTQGDFPFVHPFIRPYIPSLSRPEHGPERPYQGPERHDFGHGRPELGPGSPDQGPRRPLPGPGRPEAWLRSPRVWITPPEAWLRPPRARFRPPEA